MPLRSCSVCGKQFDPATTTAAPAFCSPRCQQIDLKRWLTEEYPVPHVRKPDEDEEGDEMRAPRNSDEE
jgi:endogenous inhibitor of DNA gyrase (YacG/DUF329 family)